MRAVEMHKLELEQLENEYDFDKYAQLRYSRLSLVSVLRKLGIDKTINDYSMSYHAGKWKISYSYHASTNAEPWDPNKMKVRLIQRHGEEFIEPYIDTSENPDEYT